MKYLIASILFTFLLNNACATEYYFNYKNEFSISRTKEILDKFKKDPSVSNVKVTQTETGFFVEWTQKEILEDY